MNLPKHIMDGFGTQPPHGSNFVIGDNVMVKSSSYPGTVISVDNENSTMTVDVGLVNAEGDTVYFEDVPFDKNLSDRKVGDKVGILVERISTK